MLERFKRKKNNNSKIAVSLMGERLVLVMVKYQAGQKPVLELCQIRNVSEEIEKSALLKEFLESHDLEKEQCICLMPSDAYDVLMVEAPDVPEEEMRDAIRWQVKDMIDFPVSEAVIDVCDIPDQNSSKNMVYVVVAKESNVRQQVNLMNNAGYQLEKIDIMELALKNIANLIPASEQGVALVRMGYERGSITLSKKGVLYFARHLSDTTSLFDKFYSEKLTAEMEGWLDTIVVEIQRSLDYYESNYRQSPVSKILLVPFLRPIEGLKEYLSSQLGVKVCYLNLNKIFEINEPLDYETMSICTPAIGAALGTEEDVTELSA